ncbi:MAG: ankyrin repeat domain-containing protein [Verrucomicrobia bacterium]|nr:ankyrin repeat domain-containing protein [Verrucomicrobiota bacterium]
MAIKTLHSNPFSHLIPTTIVSTLQETRQPSGYAPLPTVARDAIPRIHHGGEKHIAALKHQAISSIKSNALFLGSDVEIVPDDCKKPRLNQIRKSEAQSAIKLYARIDKGKTSIAFRDTPEFKQECLKLISQLMQRPSGRLLIESLAQCTRPVVLIPGEEYATEISEENEFVIFFKLDQLSYNICLEPSGEKLIEETPAFISFGHEAIHVLHRDWQRNFPARSYERSLLITKLTGPSHLPNYATYEEQFTIHGLEGENILCENALRYEFGLPERCCHIGSIYPPYDDKYQDQIHNTNSEGINWIQNAAELGLVSEVKKLIEAGANPVDGWFSAIGQSQFKVIEYFLKMEGFNPLVQNDDGATAVHIAAMHNQYRVLELFQQLGFDLAQPDSAGRLPLHYAANGNNPHSILFLVQNGSNPVNAKTKERESALSLAAESISLDSVKILLHCNARVTQSVVNALVAASDGSAEWMQIYQAINSHLDRLAEQKQPKKRDVESRREEVIRETHEPIAKRKRRKKSPQSDQPAFGW